MRFNERISSAIKKGLEERAESKGGEATGLSKYVPALLFLGVARPEPLTLYGPGAPHRPYGVSVRAGGGE